MASAAVGCRAEYRQQYGTILTVTALEDNDHRIRVLWLIKGLGPGGAEQLLLSSARVADHDRFDYTAAFVRPDKSHLVPALERSGVACELLTSGRLGSIMWPLRLRRRMRHADIVHAHSPLLAGVARIAARTLPRSQRPVTVSTEHNIWDNFALPTRLLNALTARLDARRWAVSGEVKRSMWRGLGRSATVLVHGIVRGESRAEADARSRVRAEIGIAPDAPVSITVANLRREKDYPNLLRAAAHALAENPQLVMLAVGQGPLTDEIADLHRKLKLGERFKLLGYRSDVGELLAAADLFVLSSAHEGLPVSIMEAMSAGLPIVATSVGGVPEAVTNGETGRLVPPGDSEKLADAILQIAADPVARARMGEAATVRSKEFDIRTAVTVQQQAYAELAKR